MYAELSDVIGTLNRRCSLCFHWYSATLKGGAPASRRLRELPSQAELASGSIRYPALGHQSPIDWGESQVKITINPDVDIRVNILNISQRTGGSAASPGQWGSRIQLRFIVD